MASTPPLPWLPVPSPHYEPSPEHLVAAAAAAVPRLSRGFGDRLLLHSSASLDAYHLDTLHRIRDIWFRRPNWLKRYSFLETFEHAFSASYPSCFSFFGGKESEFLDKDKLQSNNSRGNRFHGRLWTTVLVGVNILAYIAQVATQGRLLLWGAKVNSLIDEGQIWRLLTSSVLHTNVAHLMINCFSLHSIGPIVEQLSGPRRFLAVYFTSALASSVMSYQLCQSPSVGASGAIIGLVGSYAVFLWRHRELAGDGKQELQRIARVTALSMALGLLSPRIDNWGHTGGLLGGAAMSWLIGPAWHFKYRLGDGRSVFEDRAPIFRFFGRKKLR